MYFYFKCIITYIQYCYIYINIICNSDIKLSGLHVVKGNRNVKMFCIFIIYCLYFMHLILNLLLHLFIAIIHTLITSLIAFLHYLTI